MAELGNFTIKHNKKGKFSIKFTKNVEPSIQEILGPALEVEFLQGKYEETPDGEIQITFICNEQKTQWLAAWMRSMAFPNEINLN